MNKLTIGIWGQFDSLFDMIEQSINNVPDDKFNQIDNEFQYNYTVYHIIETIDFYVFHKPDTMRWGEKANIKWDENQSQIEIQKKAISKKLLLDYLSDIKLKTKEILHNWDDQRILYDDEFGSFDSIHEKLIYTIRHSAHHLGELAKSLRNWDCQKLEWK